MKEEDLIGCWQIDDVSPTTTGINAELEIALKGQVFELTSCHSLLWHGLNNVGNSPGDKSSLLSDCSTFETRLSPNDRSANDTNTILSLGGGANLVTFSFKVSIAEPKPRQILLSPLSEVVGTSLTCTRIDNPFIRARESLPFDLRTAWEERSDLWTDSQIQSKELKKFQCHEIILLSAFPSPKNELWSQLSELSTRTLEIVLFYSYSQCFPEDLTGNDLTILINETQDKPDLNVIHKRGRGLDRIHGIGIDVSRLVEEIVRSANEILARLRRFNSRENDGALSKIRPEEFISTLQCSLKNALRVVVFSSHLFHIYTTVERELELGERNSIIKYLESNIVSTFSTLRSIGSALKRSASELDFQTRLELDAQLIPEIVAFLQYLIHITSNIKTITKAALDLKMSQVCSHSKRDLAQRVAWADLMTLQSFQDYITLLAKFLRNKLTFFTRMEHSTLLQYVDVLIQEFVGELSLFNLRANNFLDVFTQRIHEGTLKFLAVTTAATLSHRLKEFSVWIRKETSLFEKLCLLMGDDPDFRASLVALGIGEMANKEHPGHQRTQRPLIVALGSLKVCQAFFRPRPAAQSDLARNVAQRFTNSPATCDLTIAIIDSDGSVEQEFSCHRIILVARCPYFQCALTSGMKEEIEGRIQLRDVSGTIFKMFLHYLYSGITPTFSEVAIETVIELLKLSDRLEMETLRCECERELSRRLHTQNALSLYVIAHDFNASNLKDQCSRILATGRNPRTWDEWADLDPTLKTELQSIWQPPVLPLRSDALGAKK